MKFRICLVISVSILLFAAGSALAQENEGEIETCNALFVSNAEGMAFDGHVLTMQGIDRTITYFCDRPVRFAGQMPIEKVRELVSQGKNNFNDIPPNAALSILDKGGKITTVVLHLYEKPVITENEMKYPVKVLLGKLPKTGGASTMFIDIVGVPVTPGSVAGVKRRTRRRTAAVATSASNTAAQQQQAAQQPPPPAQQSPPPAATESIEERLGTLDKLAAGGYITKQEYDARKKAILDSL
jgi:hypothetical protein